MYKLQLLITVLLNTPQNKRITIIEKVMTDNYKAPEAELTNPSAPGEYGSVEKALAGDYQLAPVELLKSAWATLKGLKTTFWIAAVIYGVIYMALTFAMTAIVGKSVDPITGAFSLGAFLAEMSIGLIMVPMAMGLFMIALKFSVGAKIEVGELFKHYNKIVPLFLTYLLLYLFIALGLVLLIIPGIYLMIAFTMAVPLVVEKNMGPWEALTTSRKAITHKWFPMLGFSLLSMLVIILAAIPLGIGLIWGAPLVVLAYAILYRDMFGVEDSTING
ncbi:MAG: hypothetical protein ACJAYF_001086 [Arenicella sp.]